MTKLTKPPYVAVMSRWGRKNLVDKTSTKPRQKAIKIMIKIMIKIIYISYVGGNKGDGSVDKGKGSGYNK
jgi:hypothetical protein